MASVMKKHDIKVPKWKDVQVYFTDPEIVCFEGLFLFLTISNVFLVFRVLGEVCPYPVFLTWWQVAQGLLMAWCVGALGGEFKKLEYFPKVSVDKDLLQKLFYPTLAYSFMLVLGNVVLFFTPTVATYPVVVSLTVVFHHLARFAGCAEEYMNLRWISIGVLFFAFFLGSTDPNTISLVVLPFAIMFAIASAVFRACYLQKVMHIVEGRGNALHNHQHVLGALIMPLLSLLVGEWRLFTTMPFNFARLFTWQTWGCLITIGSLPFLKNVVSNRLIRKTGQGPWRVLEILAILLVFIFGVMTSEPSPGWQGFIAILLVAGGRTIGMYDVMVNEMAAIDDDYRGGGGTALLNSQDPDPETMMNFADNSEQYSGSFVEENQAQTEQQTELDEVSQSNGGSDENVLGEEQEREVYAEDNVEPEGDPDAIY